MPTAEVNGVRLYYELSGERGDPMVLIHGSWGDHSNWWRVVPGLSESFRVLTFDRRGHSRSERVTTQGSWEEDAQDAAALLTELGLAPAHVVGNSGGAIVSLKMAVLKPLVFRSLMVHEPPLFDLLAGDPAAKAMMEDARGRAAKVIKLLEEGDKAAGARLFVETMAFGPGGWDRLTPQMRETFIGNSATWLDETRDPRGFTIDSKGLSQFRKPALLSYGGKSPPFFKAIVAKLGETIPDCKVGEYPDDGHTPHISNPQQFVSRVTVFARHAP